MTNINVLFIRPELVCDLIDKAKEFQAKEEVSFPESTPNAEYEYDLAQILADHDDDLTYREIKNVIFSLTDDERIDLLALLYLGRADFTDWEAARESAVNNLPVNLTDYLLAHPAIADHLENALEQLNYACDDSL